MSKIEGLRVILDAPNDEIVNICTCLKTTGKSKRVGIKLN